MAQAGRPGAAHPWRWREEGRGAAELAPLAAVLTPPPALLGSPGTLGTKAGGVGHATLIRTEEASWRPPERRGAPCLRRPSPPPTELGRQEEPEADPSRPPAALQSLARRRQVPRGAERSARQPRPTCLRCARVAAPWSRGQAVGPSCALLALRLSARPPARQALPHHPPPPLGRGR
ncbi:MAGE-like protein 2 [Hippopotamus amphibius kiboko]|uniref:MAGE-like protein 2 n=1 Tax=Hippopotamus amphibius kiboko TaxID=575201 RepID=UPI0025942BC8|nr:MAGE-like protein 2 [Hippopotamus amphibius kiboko]